MPTTPSTVRWVPAKDASAEYSPMALDLTAHGPDSSNTSSQVKARWSPATTACTASQASANPLGTGSPAPSAAASCAALPPNDPASVAAASGVSVVVLTRG